MSLKFVLSGKSSSFNSDEAAPPRSTRLDYIVLGQQVPLEISAGVLFVQGMVHYPWVVLQLRDSGAR
jgi:hypothetical protein